MGKLYVDLSHPNKSQKVTHYLLASILLGFGVISSFKESSPFWKHCNCMEKKDKYIPALNQSWLTSL